MIFVPAFSCSVIRGTRPSPVPDRRDTHPGTALFSSLPFSGAQSAPAHRTHRYIPASAHEPPARMIKARHRAELFDRDGIHNNWLFPGAVIKLRQRISFVNLCPARIVLLSGKVAGKQVDILRNTSQSSVFVPKTSRAAVLVLHDNLGKQTLLVSKVIEVLHHKVCASLPPARCQRHADSVSARFHQPCDIVCLIVYSVVACVRPGRKQIFRDLLSVDPAVVDTARSNIKACRYQFSLSGRKYTTAALELNDGTDLP